MSAIRLLVGCDSRPPTRDALTLAAMLADTFDATLVLATVLPHISPLSSWTEREQAAARDSTPIFARAAAHLESLDARPPTERRAMAGEPVADGLLDLARSEDADLIVIGASRRGPVGRVFLGSTGDRLLADAGFPVALAPLGYADRAVTDLRLIGLAYDGSPEAKRAAAVAVALARRACAPLRAFGVREPLSASPAAEGLVGLGGKQAHAALERDLDELLSKLPPAVGGQKVILEGDPAAALLAQGSYAWDLLVLGSHGFGRLLRTAGASVTSTVARSARWPLIAVPPSGPVHLVDPRDAGTMVSRGA